MSSFWQRVFGWMKLVSKNVWDFVRPMIQAIAAAEAKGYVKIVTGLVVEAESVYGAGKGSEKYAYVVDNLKSRLGSQFESTPYRVFDYLIHSAVAQLDQ